MSPTSLTVCVYANTYTLIINALRSITENMHDNMYIQTVAKDFSRRREPEPSKSEIFSRLNVFDYKRAEQSDRFVQK